MLGSQQISGERSLKQMHRTRRSTALGVLALCAVGLGALLFGVATHAATGQARSHAAAKVTVVTVTAGKPSELAFKLSKSSNLAAGTVTFNVTNAGAITHSFEICTKPTATSAKNSCTGKVTKMLKHGQKATLTVVLTKTGKYEYLCTVPGHAGAGMKGLLGIGVKITTTTSTNPSAVGGTGGGSTTTTGGGSTGGGSTGGGSTGGAVTYPTGNAANGKNVFNTVGCSGCHGFAAAGSPAGDGPTLDGLKLSVAVVESTVASGGAAMPPFAGQLTPQQIADVAAFVSQGSM
jgi:uncharacterized cupredoxin-like copper-binding protein